MNNIESVQLSKSEEREDDVMGGLGSSSMPSAESQEWMRRYLGQKPEWKPTEKKKEFGLNSARAIRGVLERSGVRMLPAETFPVREPIPEIEPPIDSETAKEKARLEAIKTGKTTKVEKTKE